VSPTNLAIQSSLLRSVPFALQRDAGTEATDGRTLDGYAAVFDTPTRIDSWEGCFDEIIARGAFRKTIRDTTPVLQFDHGRHPLIGSIPIGVINDLTEDDRGLHVLARLSDNWLIEPVRTAIADRAVDGMSFRFEVVREEWRDATGKVLRDADEIMHALYYPSDDGVLQRTLKELRCPELGPVVFPAYAETTVDVRSKGDADTARRDTVRELLTLTRSAEPEPQTRSEDSAPLDTEHPDHEERDENAPAAPLDSEHPATEVDAPPDAGHPSRSPDPDAERLRGQIDEVRALMRKRLAEIPDED
jgi:HK97 family phage prohead protease